MGVEAACSEAKMPARIGSYKYARGDAGALFLEGKNNSKMVLIMMVMIPRVGLVTIVTIVIVNK